MPFDLDDVSTTLIATLNTFDDIPYVHQPLARLEAFVRTSVLPPTAVAFIDDALTHKDRHVALATPGGLPLMNPFHVVFLVVAYLVLIVLGRFLMGFKKEAFRPKGIQIVHNLVLVVLSAYMMVESMRQAVLGKYWVMTNPMDRSERGLAMTRIIWVFYASKVLEFNDTFIMVLKKADRQISFLHVYHHGSIFFIWWLVTYYGPGGDAYYSVFLNSFVHTVMYSYYLSSTLGFPLSFIKPYITTIQMTQFFLMLFQASFDLVIDTYYGPVDFPRWLAWVLFFYMFSMLGLFGNFIVQNYLKKGSGGKRVGHNKKRN